jgi:hypothetical protein
LIILFLPLNPIIPIILLIGTMKLKDLNGILSKMGGILQEFCGDGFPKIVAAFFDAFYFGGAEV